MQINGGPSVTVDAIETFRKTISEAAAGDNIGVLFSKLDKGAVAPRRRHLLVVRSLGLRRNWGHLPLAGEIPAGPHSKFSCKYAVSTSR
ncbi:MAG TPA: hypothetical protein VF874_05990 [Mycobacterium sp.]